MTDQTLTVYGGVDTHKDTHTAAAMDPVGRVLVTQAFGTNAVGYDQLLAWLNGFGSIAAIGVEGTGSYGAGLTRSLQDHDIKVVEVLRPNRQTRRHQGKSDTVDAQAAARFALNGDATAEPKFRDGIVESIRMIRAVYTSSRATQTRIINQFHALVVTAPQPIQTTLTGATVTRATTAAAFRPGDDLTDPVNAAKLALRHLAKHYLELAAELEQLRSQLDQLTRVANPALRAVFGVGPDVASLLLIAAGDNPQRLRSEAAFAALCGASPVEASSGKKSKHRLNRGGDRQGNHALWRIAMVRLSHHHPATAAYAARRTGKTERAGLACVASRHPRPAEPHEVESWNVKQTSSSSEPACPE